MTRISTRLLWLSALILVLFAARTAAAGTLPAAGDTLPALTLTAPPVQADAEALGVAGTTFTLADVRAELLLLEVLGVYCPVCHTQLPGFNDLAGRIERAGLPVKMLGIAAGGTPMEVEYLRTDAGYAYPLTADEEYAVHKLLGEPKTPFTMIVTTQGKVLWTHLGEIKDIDGLFDRLRELAP